MRADFAAALHPAIHTHAGRQHHPGQQSAGRSEVARRVFGIDAHLYGVTLCLVHMPGQIGWLAGCHLDHPFDQVHMTDHFGHAVLDLQTRVDLEEIERIGVGVIDKLDCAGRLISHGLAQGHRRCEQLCAPRCRESRRRCFFDDFLIASLHRAVALAQGDDLTLSVTEQLHFDVPCIGHELFQEHAGIFEVAGRQSLHRGKSPFELCRAIALLHADATAAGRALEHHRIANSCGRC